MRIDLLEPSSLSNPFLPDSWKMRNAERTTAKAQPQLIQKSTEYKSNSKPSMKNAQHNTHAHENDKLRVSQKPVKF